MAKKSGTCIWQFVIGPGFLSGLRTAMGIDPGEVIFNVPGRTADILYPDPNIRYLFFDPAGHPAPSLHFQGI